MIVQEGSEHFVIPVPCLLLPVNGFSVRHKQTGIAVLSGYMFQQDDNPNNQRISWTAADKLGPTDSAESCKSSSVELLRNSVAALARVTHQPGEGETDRGVLTPAYEQFMGFISGSCDEAFLAHRSKNASQTHV